MHGRLQDFSCQVPPMGTWSTRSSRTPQGLGSRPTDTPGANHTSTLEPLAWIAQKSTEKEVKFPARGVLPSWDWSLGLLAPTATINPATLTPGSRQFPVPKLCLVLRQNLLHLQQSLNSLPHFHPICSSGMHRRVRLVGKPLSNHSESPQRGAEPQPGWDEGPTHHKGKGE